MKTNKARIETVGGVDVDVFGDLPREAVVAMVEEASKDVPDAEDDDEEDSDPND